MLDSILSALGGTNGSSSPMTADQMQARLISLADEFDASRRKARERARAAAASVEEDTPRAQAERLMEEVSSGNDHTAMLAALGALTADWDALQEEAKEEVATRRAKRKWEATIEAAVKAEKRHARRSRWLQRLLRLGVSAWFVQNLREKELAEYIDYGAGEQMREVALSHPSDEYKMFLEDVLIPNARWVALGEVVGSVIAVLGSVTGIKRRLAGLIGIAVSGHQLSMNYRDPLKSGLNGLSLLTQLLLMREPYEANPISAARSKLAEIPEVDQ